MSATSEHHEPVTGSWCSFVDADRNPDEFIATVELDMELNNATDIKPDHDTIILIHAILGSIMSDPHEKFTPEQRLRAEATQRKLRLQHYFPY